MKVFVASAVCVVLCVTSLLGVAMASEKKAILVVSFGTSYADTRKVTIEAVEQQVQDTFTEYEMRRAFTANIIINILRDRDGIDVDAPEQALQTLQDEGFTEVIVQPLHVIPGAEFHDLVMTVGKFKAGFEKLVIGSPLLASSEDYMNAAAALKTQLPELGDGEAVVLMGHGTHHPANAAYPALERVFEDAGLHNVLVGTVEGYPELEHVISKLKRLNIRKVTLMPFMLVAGDHAQNDMAGDEEDSWKTILTNKGFDVDVILKGMGENPQIQAIYLQHVEQAIKGEGARH